MAESTNTKKGSAGAPITVSFLDDKTLKKLILLPDYLKSYVPNKKVQRELIKIADRLRDCVYYDYREGMPTPTSNVEIDNELALLFAAEDYIRQSRKNFQRTARLMIPSAGPTVEEKHELRILNKNYLQGNYDLEDFIQDFDEMPYVATRQVDICLKKIENSIKRRQIVLQNLRKAIYEASVSGYHLETRLFKKIPSHSQYQPSKQITRTTVKESKAALENSDHASERTLEISKHASETAVENSKTEREKSMLVSKVHSESDSEDVSYTKVLKVYQAESLRLEKNLKMFGAQLQEFTNSRQNVRRVATERRNVEDASRYVRTTKHNTRPARPEFKKLRCIVVQTDRPFERIVSKDRHNKKGRPAVVLQDSDATDVSHDYFEDSDPPPVKTERNVSNIPREAPASSHHGRTDNQVPKENKKTNGNVPSKSEMRQRNDTEAKKKLLVMQPSSDEEDEESDDDNDDDDDDYKVVDIRRKLPVQPVNQVRSDVVKRVPGDVLKQVPKENKESSGTRKRNDTEAKKKLLVMQPSSDEDEDSDDDNDDDDDDNNIVDIRRKLPVQPVNQVRSDVVKRVPSDVKQVPNENKESTGTHKRIDTEAKKKLLVMQPSSDEEDEDSDDDNDIPRKLSVQPVNQVRSDVVKRVPSDVKQVPKENKESNGNVSKCELRPTSCKRNDSEAEKKQLVMQPSSDEDCDDNDDIPQKLTVPPLNQVGSDVEVTKSRVILPLPTLDPMPVYTDNCQASCVLTQLFSSRDDFDNDFEPDYVIPPYESERQVYTGKQRKVYSHLSKHTPGHQRGRC